MRRFVLTAIAAFGLSLVVEPSSAAPQPPPVVKPLNASKAEHQRIVGYWTPQRMRDAVPGEALVAGRPRPRAEARSADRQKGGGGGTAYTGYAGARWRAWVSGALPRGRLTPACRPSPTHTWTASRSASA